MKSVIDWLKKVSKKPLFLPLVSVFLVLIINVVYDAIQGNYIFEFLKFELKEGALYGRIIDILNRGSEAAILAIGMTLVVSSSAGTDISVGSVMSLAGSLCCMLLAGFGVTHVREIGDLQMPIFVGVIAGIAVAGLCGLFNGFLVAKMKIQPMVATLIFFTAGRAIGLLLTNNKMVYIHQQVDILLGLDYLEAIKRRFLQIERTDKLMLVTLQFAFRHHAFGYIKAFAPGFFQCLGIQRLLRFGFAGYEVHKQCRVVHHGFLYRSTQCLCRRLFRQLNAQRNIIKC